MTCLSGFLPPIGTVSTIHIDLLDIWQLSEMTPVLAQRVEQLQINLEIFQQNVHRDLAQVLTIERNMVSRTRIERLENDLLTLGVTLEEFQSFDSDVRALQQKVDGLATQVANLGRHGQSPANLAEFVPPSLLQTINSFAQGPPVGGLSQGSPNQADGYIQSLQGQPCDDQGASSSSNHTRRAQVAGVGGTRPVYLQGQSSSVSGSLDPPKTSAAHLASSGI